MKFKDLSFAVMAALASSIALTTFLGFAPASVLAQSEVALDRMEAHAVNRPLHSLREAADRARFKNHKPGPPREVPNFRGNGRPLPGNDTGLPDAVLQDFPGTLAATSLGSGFPGADNVDNELAFGFLIAPPDTDGQVGPGHYVQMINLLTAIFDKEGNVEMAPFPSNEIWVGIGGNCEPHNQGDPIVLYDEQADRWIFSQFAFPDDQSSYSQCVAVSRTPDPTDGYNRYEFPFDSIGFNDYPKHGIATDSVTMTANIFTKRGRRFSFGGTFLGVIDKNAMYAGTTATLIGENIGAGEFGFIAGDLDGPGTAPALFATAMTNANQFDIWQANVDWASKAFSVSRIAQIPVTLFDSEICTASRGACIPQPEGGPLLESLSDRLMHRLQLRDFGSYRTMVTAHTVDVGGGRAGIRWYEFRQPVGGDWYLYQESTFAPNDGEHRWVPSAAMNAAGDIGIGYLVASTGTFVSTAVSGQSAAFSGSGLLDANELVCKYGTGVQLDTGRAGDYSSTSVDPTTDSFWHTNEVFVQTGGFQWATWICEFSVSDGGPVNIPPTASFIHNCTDLSCTFNGSSSSDPDGSIDAYAWDFGDGNTASGATVNHPYETEGEYTVVLVVTDDGGKTGTNSQTVNVSGPVVNDPPTASFTFNCPDLSCDFDGSGSSDPDGSITDYAWDFGDGNTANGITASYAYAGGGDYMVTLTVTDDGGLTGGDVQTVSVSDNGDDPTLVTLAFGVRNKWTATVEWSDGSPLSGTWNTGDDCIEQIVCELSGINRKVLSVDFTESTTQETVTILKP